MAEYQQVEMEVVADRVPDEVGDTLIVEETKIIEEEKLDAVVMDAGTAMSIVESPRVSLYTAGQQVSDGAFSKKVDPIQLTDRGCDPCFVPPPITESFAQAVPEVTELETQTKDKDLPLITPDPTPEKVAEQNTDRKS